MAVTLSSCAGGADEVKATVDYGPQTAGTGNNLLPVSASQGAGDGSLTATTAIGYDDVGNVTSVDGPLAGSDDTTLLRYDADRERVGVVSPDPDGGGSLKRRAQRVTYNAHGIPVETEIGTVDGTSDGDWDGVRLAPAGDDHTRRRRPQGQAGRTAAAPPTASPSTATTPPAARSAPRSG